MKNIATLNDTATLAASLAPLLRAGDTLTLSGDVGAGKTTFAGFLLKALGWRAQVTSPTYTLVQTYDLPAFTVWHLDAYRLEQPCDLYVTGWQEAASGVRLVEWPEKIALLLPENRLELTLTHGIEQASGESRRCQLTPCGNWLLRLPPALRRGQLS
jgi:tRNA threonylcarbamoyladenosine biosynthesis protein TsaE